MSKNRKKYTSKEKAKIALAAIKGEQTLAQISSEYSVHSTQINAWKKQVLDYIPEVFTNKEKQVQTNHEAELAQLYEQIGRLKVENEFLKKKFSMFS
jgi:transposase